jgi:hypothetical protein
MIALKNYLPLLRCEEGERPIRPAWACGCVRTAAERAGYANWWLAEPVGESVLEYLASCYSRNVIGLAAFVELFRAALTSIGYSEVASRFEALPLPFELSLADLARESGPGYELGFFYLLSERIRPALAKPQTSFQLSELHGCVRYLRSAKTWSRNCSQLRTEIVEFVRAELFRINVPILLTIR